MVPPGIHRYFYSFNGEYTFNQTASMVSLEDDLSESIQRKLEKNNPHAKSEFMLDKVNYIDAFFQEKPWIDADTYEVGIKHCVPRPDKKLERNEEERPRTPWVFSVSLFKEYRQET